MTIERILGTDTGTDAFGKTDRNFVSIDAEKLPISHNTDATAHDDIREQINNLVPKANIIQTDAVNDSTKIPSSAITYVHGQEIDAINNKISVKDFSLLTNDFHTTDISAGEYTIYSDTILNGPYAGNIAGAITIRKYNSTDLWLEFRPWNSVDIYITGYFSSAWKAWTKITPTTY